MDSNTFRELQGHLTPGESVLWAGMPGQGLRFVRADIWSSLFSIVWLGFVLAAGTGLLISKAGNKTTMPVFILVPFLAVGLYQLIFRHFWDMYVRSTSRYAVTNYRLLVVRGKRSTSSAIGNLPQLTLDKNLDGSGTINFSPAFALSKGSQYPGLGADMSFRFIKDAQTVFDLIIKQQSKQT